MLLKNKYAPSRYGFNVDVHNRLISEIKRYPAKQPAPPETRYRKAPTAFANDYIEQQIYSDKNFEQNRAKAVRMLEQRGYQVHDIEADDKWGKPVLEVEAYKNGREYDITLSYPSLKIIREKLDD